MRDMIFICIIAAVFVMGDFLMKRIDRFLEENNKDEEKNENGE